MARIELGGISLRFERQGDGPALLYLHPEHFFDHQQAFIDELACQWTVTSPRHPRFFADCPAGSLRTVDDLAFLYLDFLDALDCSEVVVVGASFGGWLALEMAIRDSSRIRALALVGPLGTKLGGRDERDFADLFALPEEDVRGALFHTLDNAPDYGAMTDDAFTAHAVEREAVAHYAWKPHLYSPVLSRWLHRVTCPTLVLRGAHDGYVQEHNTRALAEALPEARLAVVGETGHYPQVEDPRLVARLINDFACDVESGSETIR